MEGRIFFDVMQWERGGAEGALCILPEILFLAASLPLLVYSPMRGAAKFSCTVTEACSRNKNRNGFVVRAHSNSQRCSIIRGTEGDRSKNKKNQTKKTIRSKLHVYKL